MPTKRRAIRLAATLLSCAALQLGGAAPAAAQADKEPAVPEKAGKELRALRLSGDAPHIDGLLDDAAWALADSIDDFVQWEPDNMEPLTERTVIRVVYDDRHLYVGVYCYDSEPSQIGSGFGRRDDPPPSDEIFIGFDPRHDHLTGYVFGTNPSGVFSDVKFFDDVSADSDYDAVWEVKTAVTEDGWTAEFRIPFSQMRFSVPDAAEARWGFDVRREIQRKGEQGQWVGRPRGERGQVSRWGHLIFTAELPSPHRMEALPYTAARREDLPGDAPSDHDVLVGADFRMGLGTAATLSATVNPDFAQVEQDPAVLNLTIFESFFPEKRPFFLEDARTFIPPYGLFRLFHSRRIGRRPGRYGLEEGDELVEWPVLTTIIGAGKVTGKSSGWTYGALSTLTAREYAVVDSIGVDSTGAETATRISRLIEPLTSYSAARIQRDIMGGSSNVGAIATAVIREGDADAATGGIDYKIRWDRNRFEWNGHWAVTRAPGPGGMATGFGGVSNFGWNGKHFEFNVHVDHLGRDFRVTDLGFLFTRIDRSNVNLGLGVKQPDPWGIFRSVSVRAGADRAWNGDGVVFDREVWLSTSGEFRNYWSWELVGWYEFETLDDRDTRGGPPIVSPAFPGGGLWIGTDSRKSWRLSLQAFGGKSEVGSWNILVGPSLSVNPSTRLQASLSADYEFGVDDAQWITNDDVDGDGETDYVYGTLRRDVLSITARSTLSLTRDLTVELFMQPFVAVGDYSNIRKLAEPSSYEFEPVSLDYDPDFNSKSLRGNLVIRWEYLRGSTLFVVWNVSTFDGSNAGVFDPLRDLSRAFSADGIHAFMIKVNYWLNL